MTDHEKNGNYSGENDPLFAHLDFETPTIMIDRDGQQWIQVNFETERQKLLDDFYDHMLAYTQMYGDVDMSNEESYRAFVHNLGELMADEEEKIELYMDEWVQVGGLEYILHDGKPHRFKKGGVLRGRYQGIELYPCYDISTGKSIETLPIGVSLAVTDLWLVSDDGETEEQFDFPEGDHVLLTLHGPGIEVRKFEPVIAA
ncbi:MAG: hypothetical protein ABIQ04_01445 [Candidatus Saccharimonadales bacterium]